MTQKSPQDDTRKSRRQFIATSGAIIGTAAAAGAYGAERPGDMMDKARALPTSLQAQQQQQDVINRVLAA